MPIDYAKLKNWPVPDIEHRYEVKDTILYALGLGCGSDPVDEDDLRFGYARAGWVLDYALDIRRELSHHGNGRERKHKTHQGGKESRSALCHGYLLNSPAWVYCF